MGFTGNSRGVRLVLLILLALFGAGGLGWCSKAKADELELQGLTIGFGSGHAGSEPCFGALLLTQSFADERWVGFLNTHGESSSCRDREPVRANIAAGVIRTTHLGPWSIGFGAALREHGDVVVGPYSIVNQTPPRVEPSAHLAAVIFVRRELGQRFVVDLLHLSTGGSTYFNS